MDKYQTMALIDKYYQFLKDHDELHKGQEKHVQCKTRIEKVLSDLTKYCESTFR